MNDKETTMILIIGAGGGIIAVALIGAILAMVLKSCGSYVDQPLFRIEIVEKSK